MLPRDVHVHRFFHWTIYISKPCKNIGTCAAKGNVSGVIALVRQPANTGEALSQGRKPMDQHAEMCDRNAFQSSAHMTGSGHDHVIELSVVGHNLDEWREHCEQRNCHNHYDQKGHRHIIEAQDQEARVVKLGLIELVVRAGFYEV